jgi:hypothetical protein
MDVAVDGRVGDDAHERAVEANPSQADGGRNVDALREAQGNLAGRAVEDLALSSHPVCLGAEQRAGRLAGRVCHPFDAANRGCRQRVERADRAGRDPNLAAALARRRQQLALHLRDSQDANADGDQIDSGRQHARPVLAQRVVTGDFDHDIRTLRQQLVECPNNRQRDSACPRDAGLGAGSDNLELVPITRRQLDNRLADRAVPDQTDAPWFLAHAHCSPHVMSAPPLYGH